MLFYEDNYNFLSKMCLGRMRRACCDMIARARRTGARVIAAGSDASDAPDQYLLPAPTPCCAAKACRRSPRS